MMVSEVEKVAVELLYQLKDQKRRFIALEPCENAKALNVDAGKRVLKLSYYEALINARVHMNLLKGKYAFVFDLENESHLHKLQQLAGNSSEYHIYSKTEVNGLA
ncbi:hypothetical protein [Niabella hibiscisoli]|uniref:hypothetical protein n=1 Tax=Niabella hibiscisoli TaxID=1825928 RepID=UPI001F0E07C4|nr:hypothetical protein [Niabella hibiscisoli]MCH5718940.1 hypothetical protein [Niabella hibiscisoli]